MGSFVRHRALAGIVLLGCSLAVAPAWGTVFTDRPAWNAAVTIPSGHSIDFEGIGTGIPTSISFNSDLTITDDDDIDRLLLQNASYFGGINNDFTTMLSLNELFHSMRIDFLGTGTTAFGLDLFTRSQPGKNVTVSVYLVGDTTPSFTQTYSTTASGAVTFFGFTAATAIDKVILQNFTNGTVLIDNLAYGTTNSGGGEPGGGETPEGATLAYVALGISGVLIGRYRRGRFLESCTARS